jgi:hypothetical protein
LLVEFFVALFSFTSSSDVMADRIVELVLSRKRIKRVDGESGILAILDGYIIFNTNSKSAISYKLRHYWKCKNCDAQLIIGEDDAVGSVGDHTCNKSLKEVIFFQLVVTCLF